MMNDPNFMPINQPNSLGGMQPLNFNQNMGLMMPNQEMMASQNIPGFPLGIQQSQAANNEENSSKQYIYLISILFRKT